MAMLGRERQSEQLMIWETSMTHAQTINQIIVHKYMYVLKDAPTTRTAISYSVSV